MGKTKGISRAAALAAMFFVLFGSGAVAEESERRPIEVALEDDADLILLAGQGLDIWDVEDGTATIYASAADEDWLGRKGFSFRGAPMPPDLAERGANDTGDYLTYEEYVAQMQAWVADYPEFVSLQSIGKSWENRDVWMLKISDNVAEDEEEAEVLLLSLQHAREWLSGMALRGIVEHLLEDYSTDARARAAVDYMEIYVVLVANPDGYAYTHSTERLWRKNRRVNGNGTFGVDLNRNWPFQWSLASTDPNSNLYRGPAPNSEPENVMLLDWMESRGDELVGCLNYHTHGMLFMYNWAYTLEAAPNIDAMQPVAEAYASAVQAVHGQTSSPGQWSHVLGYTGGGTTIDFFQAVRGIPTLTLELRSGAIDGRFIASDAQIQPTVEENIAGAHTFLAWLRAQRAAAELMTLGNIELTLVSPTEARFEWTTSAVATRAVDYGESIVYDQAAEPDTLRDVTHSVTLPGLQPGTIYHARLRSTGLGGRTVVSDDIAFRTSGGPGVVSDFVKSN